MTRITAKWLHQPESAQITALLQNAGHQIYFVGGCVRNTLLHAPVADLDLATDATPDIVMKLAENAGLHVVPTGIDHGTVTVIVQNIPYEITTFRKDISTDGRRATVAFSTSLADDAHRRDFTINALYAAPDGTLSDPVDGLPDLYARRLRFIDDPNQRIAEDYLRILRFFRFHAWYGDPAQGLDADGLAACAAGQDGIDTLSNERIGAEMRKLLAAPDPAPAIAAMAQTGILARVMPGADPRALTPLIHIENGMPPDWLRRAAVLGGDDPTDHWRLSRAEARDLTLLRDLIGADAGLPEIAYRHGADTAHNIALIRAASFEQPLPTDLETQIASGANAVFPISATDLMPQYQGAALGKHLKTLEARWIASGFALTKDQLL